MDCGSADGGVRRRSFPSLVCHLLARRMQAHLPAHVTRVIRLLCGGSVGAARLLCKPGRQIHNDVSAQEDLSWVLPTINTGLTPVNLKMSGVEIAGLVLSVIPIVAAAAEHQRRVFGAATTIFSQRVRDERLASHYQHLHNEVALLNLTIRGLISDLPTLNADDKTKLLTLERPLWEDDRVELALSQRLGTSNVAFVDTVQEILTTLDGILSDRVLKLEKSDIAVGVSMHDPTL